MFTKLARSFALIVFFTTALHSANASTREISKLKPVSPKKDLALRGMLDNYLKAHPDTKKFAHLVEQGQRNYRGKWMKVRVHFIEDSRGRYMRSSVRGLAWKNNVYIRFDPSKAGNPGWKKTVKGWKYKGPKNLKFVIYNSAYHKQVTSTLIHEIAHAQGFVVRGKAYGELIAFRTQGAFCERVGIKPPYATKELAKFANEPQFRGWLKENHRGYRFHFAQQESMRVARAKWLGRYGKLSRGAKGLLKGALRWAGPAYAGYGVYEYARGNVDKGKDVFAFILSYGVVTVFFAVPEAILLPAGPPGWAGIAALEGTKIALSIMIQGKVRAYMDHPLREAKFDHNRLKKSYSKVKKSIKKGSAKVKSGSKKIWKSTKKKAKSLGKTVKGWFN